MWRKSRWTRTASCDRAGVIRTWMLGDTAETTDASAFENWPLCFRGHSARARSLEFSPDGKRLVSASNDGTVRVWTGRVQPLQKLQVAPVTSTFSRSGSELILAGEQAIQIWNRQTGEVRPFGNSFSETAESVRVSPDGALIAIGHNDGSIRLWDRETGQVNQLLTRHEGSVDEIAFSSDSKRLVSASWDGTARIWDVATGEQLAVVHVPPHCRSAAFSPDGRTLAISSENNAMLYDATSGKRLHLLQGHQNTAQCVAFSPDGRWLATGSHDRTIRIWDVETGETRHVISAQRGKIRSIAYSPDGRIIASGSLPGTIAFSHVETGRFLFDVKTGIGTIRHLDFSPDGETLAATWPRNAVYLLHAVGPRN
jgi:WD40 repeat protein